MDNKDPRITRTPNGRIYIDGIALGTWAVEHNLNPSHLRKLVAAGTSVETIIYHSKNRHVTKTYSFKGKEWTLSELYKSEYRTVKISISTFVNRVTLCRWSVEDALTKPLNPYSYKDPDHPSYTYKGVFYKTLSDLCATLGCDPIYLKYHLSKSESLEEAVERLNSDITEKTSWVKYKGKLYTYKQLVEHPDNIHGYTEIGIRHRANCLTRSDIDLDCSLFVPVRNTTRSPFTYRGEDFGSIYAFATKYKISLGELDFLLATYGQEDIFFMGLDRFVAANSK